MSLPFIPPEVTTSVLRPQGTPSGKEVTTPCRLPRIVLTDTLGKALNTDTSYQRKIAEARRLLAEHPLEQSNQVHEWRLPKAPVPARPDYTKYAADHGHKRHKTEEETPRERVQPPHPVLCLPKYLSTIFDVYVKQFAPIKSDEFAHLMYLQTQSLLRFPDCEFSIFDSNRVYLPFCGAAQLHYREPTFMEGRGRDEGYPGSIPGRKRQKLCYGCERASGPHYHGEKRAPTGGGFTYYAKDRLTGNEQKLPKYWRPTENSPKPSPHIFYSDTDDDRQTSPSAITYSKTAGDEIGDRLKGQSMFPSEREETSGYETLRDFEDDDEANFIVHLPPLRHPVHSLGHDAVVPIYSPSLKVPHTRLPYIKERGKSYANVSAAEKARRRIKQKKVQEIKQRTEKKVKSDEKQQQKEKKRRKKKKTRQEAWSENKDGRPAQYDTEHPLELRLDSSSSGVSVSSGSEWETDSESEKETKPKANANPYGLKRRRRKNLYRPPKFFQLKKTSRKSTKAEDPFSKDRHFEMVKTETFAPAKSEKKVTVAKDPFSDNREYNLPTQKVFQPKKSTKESTKAVEFNFDRSNTNYKAAKKFEIKQRTKTSTEFWEPPERKTEKPSSLNAPKQVERPVKPKPQPPKPQPKPQPKQEKPKERPKIVQAPKPKPKPKPAETFLSQLDPDRKSRKVSQTFLPHKTITRYRLNSLRSKLVKPNRKSNKLKNLLSEGEKEKLSAYTLTPSPMRRYLPASNYPGKRASVTEENLKSLMDNYTKQTEKDEFERLLEEVINHRPPSVERAFSAPIRRRWLDVYIGDNHALITDENAHNGSLRKTQSAPAILDPHQYTRRLLKKKLGMSSESDDEDRKNRDVTDENDDVFANRQDEITVENIRDGPVDLRRTSSSRSVHLELYMQNLFDESEANEEEMTSRGRPGMRSKQRKRSISLPRLSNSGLERRTSSVSSGKLSDPGAESPRGSGRIPTPLPGTPSSLKRPPSVSKKALKKIQRRNSKRRLSKVVEVRDTLPVNDINQMRRLSDSLETSIQKFQAKRAGQTTLDDIPDVTDCHSDWSDSEGDDDLLNPSWSRRFDSAPVFSRSQPVPPSYSACDVSDLDPDLYPYLGSLERPVKERTTKSDDVVPQIVVSPDGGERLVQDGDVTEGPSPAENNDNSRKGIHLDSFDQRLQTRRLSPISNRQGKSPEGRDSVSRMGSSLSGKSALDSVEVRGSKFKPVQRLSRRPSLLAEMIPESLDLHLRDRRLMSRSFSFDFSQKEIRVDNILALAKQKLKRYATLPPIEHVSNAGTPRSDIGDGEIQQTENIDQVEHQSPDKLEKTRQKIADWFDYEVPDFSSLPSIEDTLQKIGAKPSSKDSNSSDNDRNEALNVPDDVRGRPFSRTGTMVNLVLFAKQIANKFTGTNQPVNPNVKHSKPPKSAGLNPGRRRRSIEIASTEKRGLNRRMSVPILQTAGAKKPNPMSIEEESPLNSLMVKAQPIRKKMRNPNTNGTQTQPDLILQPGTLRPASGETQKLTAAKPPKTPSPVPSPREPTPPPPKPKVEKEPTPPVVKQPPPKKEKIKKEIVKKEKPKPPMKTKPKTPTPEPSPEPESEEDIPEPTPPPTPPVKVKLAVLPALPPPIPEPQLIEKEPVVRHEKTKCFIEAVAPEEEEEVKKRPPPPIIKRRKPPPVIKKKRIPARPPPSPKGRELNDVDSLDYLAKYCIIHPERLPLYEKIFKEVVSNQKFKYDDVTVTSYSHVGDDSDDETSRRSGNNGLLPHEYTMMRDLTLISRSATYIEPGDSLTDAHMQKLAYTLDSMQAKYQEMQRRLEELLGVRTKSLADLIREKYPDLADPEYEPKGKKKKGKKKDKKSKTFITESDRQNTALSSASSSVWRNRTLTDQDIINRLDHSKTEQLSSVPTITKLDLEIERCQEKLTNIDERMDELEEEKRLVALYSREQFLQDQGRMFDSDFKRKQSALFQKMHPDTDLEMNIEEVESALKQINNNLLTEKECQFIYHILDVPGKRRVNLQLFSVIASLSERIMDSDPIIRKLINKFNFDALDVKMEKCKELFYLLCDQDIEAPDGKITARSLAVELAAGGVSPEHTKYVLGKFNREKKGIVDFLDYLTYVPLFIEIHDRIVNDPLSQSRPF